MVVGSVRSVRWVIAVVRKIVFIVFREQFSESGNRTWEDNGEAVVKGSWHVVAARREEAGSSAGDGRWGSPHGG